MEPIVPHKKLEPGVFQGRPDVPESEKVTPPRLIRTMQLDMADAVKNQNETVVSIAIAEEKKKAVARAESSTIKTGDEKIPPAPKPHGRIIIVIVVLLMISALGLAYVFVLPKFGGIKLPDISIPSFPSFSSGDAIEPTATTTEPIVSLAPSLIPAQTEKRFNITDKTREQILDEVSDELMEGATAGSIKNIHFEELVGTEPTTISANRLFVFADIFAPEILNRSLEKPFMIGFWGEENWGATPFIILKVSGYDTGFAGMLDWEKDLPRAFDSLFGTNINAELKSKIKFQDIVVLEKDARVVETPSGDTIAYVFANENTIVIAGSQKALVAIVTVAGKN